MANTGVNRCDCLLTYRDVQVRRPDVNRQYHKDDHRSLPEAIHPLPDHRIRLRSISTHDSVSLNSLKSRQSQNVA